MTWLKRVVLFALVNFAIILVLSIILSLLQVERYLGPGWGSLLVFCAIFGFGGALTSLFLSRVMAKWMMGVRVIDPQRPGSSLERELVWKVHSLARKAGLTVMPEVGIYESPEVNAFATGPTKNRALVAVSRGLLEKLDTKAVEGVLGHEVAHHCGGDGRHL